MGVIDLERMNKALLLKWLVRFYDNQISGTWKSILIEKYGRVGDVRITSSFWKDILKDKAFVINYNVSMIFYYKKNSDTNIAKKYFIMDLI